MELSKSGWFFVGGLITCLFMWVGFSKPIISYYDLKTWASVFILILYYIFLNIIINSTICCIKKEK